MFDVVDASTTAGDDDGSKTAARTTSSSAVAVVERDDVEMMGAVTVAADAERCRRKAATGLTMGRMIPVTKARPSTLVIRSALARRRRKGVNLIMVLLKYYYKLFWLF